MKRVILCNFFFKEKPNVYALPAWKQRSHLDVSAHGDYFWGKY